MSQLLRNRSDGQLEQNVSQSQIDEFLTSYVIYGVEGLVLGVSNLLIAFVVLLYSDLRVQKEYVIVAGQSFANGLQGLAFVAAGIGRSSLINAGNGFVLVSRWSCFWTAWNFIFLWSSPWVELMLLVLSIDRFLAVAFPLRYFTLTHRYAYMLVGAGYLAAIPSVLAGVITSYPYQRPEKPAYCSTNHGMNDQWYNLRTTLRLTITFSSVAFYVPILFLLYRTINKGKDSSAMAASKLARLKKATITLGISTLFLFLFQIVPDLIILFNLVNNKLPLYIITNGNEIANFFIYTMRFKDIRKGLVSMFTLRPLKLHQGTKPTRSNHRSLQTQSQSRPTQTLHQTYFVNG